MMRFSLPKTMAPGEELTACVNGQLDAFLSSGALREMLCLLETDLASLEQRYNGRIRSDGSVIEMQVMEERADMGSLRKRLFSLFEALGFVRVNRPLRPDNSHILVLGGSLNACFERSLYAREFLTSVTQRVDGLASYRPIHPVERGKPEYCSLAETEFGALSEAMMLAFDLPKNRCEDDFHSDRNLNGIFCVRSFDRERTGPVFRVLAAPSGAPDQRRADTADCVRFYLDRTEVSPENSILFVTSARYCNRQFLQILCAMLKAEKVCPFDVVGCAPSGRIETPETYPLFSYIQDLISTIEWIFRLRALLNGDGDTVQKRC